MWSCEIIVYNIIYTHVIYIKHVYIYIYTYRETYVYIDMHMSYVYNLSNFEQAKSSTLPRLAGSSVVKEVVWTTSSTIRSRQKSHGSAQSASRCIPSEGSVTPPFFNHGIAILL